MTTNEPAQTTDVTVTGRMLGLEAQLITQAVQDSAFRQQLMADPKAVLAEKGLDVPDGVQINVVQETPSQYYLVLPALEAPEGVAELSDEELEAVAGGNIDSKNANWTGCASGRSGCVATNGCSVAAAIGSALGAGAAVVGGVIAAAPTGGVATVGSAVAAVSIAGACGIAGATSNAYG
jgi:Nitrile hydratase, alpha chain